ncbi:Acetyltransferase (GNAT) domain-containing protein [Mesonia phycicola]|uniref:Acetyltransferase (GNAT) domain-containing protein n=1 Tax=Mesonia phycicola TaxID=579105 RepID=A0A1M6AGN3_9FLAO|nr:GNAT family N-acetyltransferase [Mesonia phycicola]SHI35373.1 Acetyltransferase (GNAT) domain-containing protein [Mesonia phycicola]
MILEIKKVSTKDILSIRQQVLRNGKPIKECLFDGDNLETTQHFGLYKDQKITAIATIMKDSCNTFSNSNQYRLRGMAVLPEFQHLGLGKKLLSHCEKEIVKKTPTLLWFNARTKAVPFYKKLHFKVYGEEFNIPNVGPHYLMYKIYE